MLGIEPTNLTPYIEIAGIIACPLIAYGHHTQRRSKRMVIRFSSIVFRGLMVGMSLGYAVRLVVIYGGF